MIKPILVLVAVDDELSLPVPYPFLKVVIGVGKINAAINTFKAIVLHKPDRVINFGTAGSLNPEYVPGLYKVGSVVQRDFDARPLTNEIGVVPYDKTPMSLDFGDGPSLSTGDNFVTSTPEVKSDLVDMEAFAIAKVCQELDIPLDIFKYVTDNADENAANDWLTQMRQGSREFLDVINSV